MIDLHVHTALCGHADGMPVDYVRAAAAGGVTVLGFTDHMPLAPSLSARIPGASRYSMALDQLEHYVAEVSRARELGRELGVEVLLGIEADLVQDGIEHARALAASVPFDIVLGSVHFVDDWAFDDPALIDRYAEWDVRDLWERYFDELLRAAASGVADVIAHADLVKKFCGAPEGPIEDLLRQVAGELAGLGVAVEVNTAGLRKPCSEIYPGAEFLRALSTAGVPVTLGSDAHTPSEVGRDHAAGVRALRDAGYRSVLVFRGRTAEEVPLDDA
jgi:histidinol-phosphatase (PHP family)